jgi:tetratricopeptide (TPR) repeat protein
VKSLRIAVIPLGGIAAIVVGVYAWKILMAGSGPICTSGGDHFALYVAGVDEFSKGRLASAISCFGRAIERYPEYHEAYGMRAQSYMAKGDFEAAVRDATEALRYNPYSVQYRQDRGNAYMKLGRTSEALKDLNDAIGRSAAIRPILFYLRAQLHASQNRLDEAIADYSKAIGEMPENGDLYFLRGSAHEAKKDYEQALSDYNRMVEFSPKNVAYWTTRGNFFMQRGDHEGAIADYSEAIKLAPDRPESYTSRANAYDRLNRAVDADGDRKRAAELASRKVDRAGSGSAGK